MSDVDTHNHFPAATNRIVMVRPAVFGYNPESADDNAYMRLPRGLSLEQSTAFAKTEFDGLVERLRAEGVEVLVVQDDQLPTKLEAIFPNNWFSTHVDGTLVTYPMARPSRRVERSHAVLSALREGFAVRRHINLEPHEEQGVYLEGTGSFVLDRANRIAYLARSERSQESLAQRWAELMAYTLVAFDAVDVDGGPIYHTNVMMSVGEQVALVGFELCSDSDQRRLRAAFAKTGHTLVELTAEQVSNFAGNTIQVRDGSSRRRWVMSSRAYDALRPDQRALLEREAPIIHSAISTVESIGGGSVRCMIAENFLPVGGTTTS